MSYFESFKYLFLCVCVGYLLAEWDDELQAVVFYEAGDILFVQLLVF